MATLSIPDVYIIQLGRAHGIELPDEATPAETQAVYLKRLQAALIDEHLKALINKDEYVKVADQIKQIEDTAKVAADVIIKGIIPDK